MGVDVVGLGPGRPGHLTGEAIALLGRFPVILRTARHPTVEHLLSQGLRFTACDDIYADATDFASVYRRIAQRVAAAAEGGSVVYAVPGSPCVAEASVSELKRLVPDAVIHPAVSFVDVVAAAVGIDPVSGLGLFDAQTLLAAELDPGRPALLAQIYSDLLAGHVKLTLLELYSPEHEVAVVRAAGVPGGEAVNWGALGRLHALGPFDHLTTLYLPPVADAASRGSMASLMSILGRLRGAGGCPWDRQQTHASLRPFVLEEAAEVAEAIDSGDAHNLCDELGDLLLQVGLHALIAAEAGDFTLADVIRSIARKMVRRHPHVFGDVTAASPQAVVANWERIKAGERGHPEPASLLAVPGGLPALARSQRLQEQAARVGFDWPDASGVLAKLEEELAEVREAMAGDTQRQAGELGDLIFAAVNVARWCGVEAETAAAAAAARFIRRFRSMEAAARRRGLELDRLSLSDLDDLWEEAKTEERNDNGRHACGEQG